MWNFYFELWHWQGGGEVYNNYFDGSACIDVVDIIKGTYSYGLKIYSNTFYQSTNIPYPEHGGQAIDIEERGHIEDVYVFDNHIINYVAGIWMEAYVHTSEGYASANVQNVFIHDNVLENMGASGLGGGQGIKVENSGPDTNVTFSNVNIFNNTMVGIVQENMPEVGIRWYAVGTLDGLHINNNIIVGYGAAVKFALAGDVSSASMTNLKTMNNLFFACNYNTINLGAVTIIGGSIQTGNLTVDPLFMAIGNLRLQSSSPCINAGTLFFTSDHSYSGGLPDIGKYEFGR